MTNYAKSNKHMNIFTNVEFSAEVNTGTLLYRALGCVRGDGFWMLVTLYRQRGHTMNVGWVCGGVSSLIHPTSPNRCPRAAASRHMTGLMFMTSPSPKVLSPPCKEWRRLSGSSLFKHGQGWHGLA
ncbi:uncharacterized protein [Dendropsophus ebraccatus]|uniref:uncharacterized protein isoform X8 n=1 Tax=Dendropsophus ebraccatus TaxID=150705 RepID=UPI0038316D15